MSERKGHNDNFRRTWNKEDYKPKPKPKPGKSKNEFSKEEIIKKEKLKARNFLLNLEKNVGHTSIVKKVGDALASGGYYCDVCQCALNDSINFLDHINGIKHQKMLGMTMKVEKSSIDKVKERINSFKQRTQTKEEETELSFEERVELAKQKEKEEKRLKKQQKKKKKQEEQMKQTCEQPNNEEMIKIMGFGNFKGK